MPDAPRKPYISSAAAGLFASALVTALLALACNALSTGGIGRYGWALFTVAPLVMGFAASAFFCRWHGSITFGQSMLVTLVGLLLAAVALLVIRWEGLICLAMAAPLGLVGGAIGGGVAVWASKRGKRQIPPTLPLLALLVFPVAAWGEAKWDQSTPSSIVTTSVILPATPAEIWPHLQNFTIEEEPDFIGFRAGIAYPLATRTTGTGIGALRACILSTGTMPERITAWQPPYHLAFDVLGTPPPMSELSPYATVEPRHLHDTYISRRGEFRLEALPDGTTRLSGTSWYEQRLWPGWYWLAYSDAVVQAVHHRVYEQIATDLAKDRARAQLAHR